MAKRSTRKIKLIIGGFNPAKGSGRRIKLIIDGFNPAIVD
jgi:hypothetical protein